MANKKISELTALSAQSDTDLYETSANGTGSFKETRAQMVSYFQSSIPNKQNALYVSKLGNDTTGNGSFNKPFLTCGKANTAAVAGQTIYVDAGTYSESPITFTPNITWVGVSPNSTIIQATLLNLNNGVWNTTTSPYLQFYNLTLSAGSLEFLPTSYVSNSLINFSNANVNANASISKIAKLNIISSQFSSLTMTSILSTISRGSTYLNDITLTSSGIAEVTTITFSSMGDSFNTGSVYTNTSDGTTINFTASNATQRLSYLSEDGNGNASVNLHRFYFDLVSYPDIFDYTTTASVYPIEKFTILDTSQGLGDATKNEFFWFGPSHTFAAGRGAHITAGTDNVLLGMATSSKNGTFVWADNSDLANNWYPASNYQFVTRAVNGYGFNTRTPQANFHVAAGTAGTFLVSANGVVADANMANGELNPYITTTDLIFKVKDTAGTVRSYSISSTPSFNNPVFTGIANASGTFRTNCNPLMNLSNAAYNATSGATISAADFVGGVISVNPSGNQVLTSPTAAQINTALTALFGTLADGDSVRLIYFNQSIYASTINAGSGVLFSRGGSSTVVPATTTVVFTILRSSGNYIVFGN
jgi:hypothetical protein